jgi:uncharacterized repeat protein (TIGR01451 family)
MKTIFLWLKLLTIFTLTTFLTTTLDAVDITLDNTIVKINGDGNSVTCHNDDIYRLGTLTFFKGQAFDILIKVLVEENEADQLKNFQSPFIERPCIGVKNGLIESILRDTNDENGNNDANDKAYMDLELSIVKKGTLERMTVDRLQFSGFDLDRSANRSASDDIYISTPGRAYVDNNNSLITVEEGDFGNGYDIKMQGNIDITKPTIADNGNCHDSVENAQLECRGSGIIEASSVFRIRVSNDDAFGSLPESLRDGPYYRLIQISLEESDIVGLGIDHGDMPESYGDAYSDVNISLVLGSSPADGEASQYSSNADADDNTENDDEGAVSLVGITSNGSGFDMTQNYPYELNITTTGNGYLNAWIDLNKDGDFSDNGEHFITGTAVSGSETINTLYALTLPDTTPLDKTYMRVRLSNNPNAASSGYEGIGEVEDYAIYVKESGTVTGRIYNDKNGNGTQDADESGFPNITVLITAANGEKQTVLTDENGDYDVPGVALGLAVIDIDDTTLPVGAKHIEGTDPTSVTINANETIVDNDGYQIQADLVTAKTVDNTTPQAGDTIIYTIKVINNGPAQATNVSLTDKLPSGLTYVSHAGGDYIPNSGLWTIGTLDNGATATLNITVTVDAGESGSTITNVTTSASTPDQNDATTGGDDLNESIIVSGSPDLMISDARIIEGGELVFDVNLSSVVHFDTVVALTQTDVTTSPSDRSVAPSTVTIPANAISVRVNITALPDNIVETPETFKLKGEITSSVGQGKTAEGTGTILDDDVNTQTVDISDATVPEESGEIVFTVSIPNPSSEDTVVTLKLTDGTTSPEDHGDVAETVTIPAGATSVTTAIPVTNDDVAERDEIFTLAGEITSILGNGKTAEGTGTITDDDINDLIPYVSDASLPEPTGADDENMTFIVTLSHEVSEDTTIEMSIEDGQTTDADRGTPSPVSFIILAGERNATVYVPIHPDALAESDETFNLIATIKSPLGENATGGGAGTIEEVNPDEAFAISNESAKEGEDENLTFEVTLTQASTVDTTIELSLTDVTTDGNDHGDLTPINVTIPAGETTAYVNVPVTEDFVSEDNPSVETLSIDGVITDGLPASIGKIANGLGSISDGVIPDGWLNIDDVKVNESAGTMTFTVSVDRPYYADSEVKLELRDVTAEKGADYVELNVTNITIPANASEVTVTVGITEDLILEADETFELYGEVTSSAYLGQNDTGTGTIVDNDKTVIIIDNNGGSPSGDGVVEGQPLIFDINLSLPSSEDIVLELSTTDGTATAPDDYITTTQTITIEAGETHAIFEVPTVDDEEDEADRETIIISAKIISGIDGNPIAHATGIIRDNDVMAEDDIIKSDDSHVPASVNVLDNDANNSNPTTVDLKPSDDAPVGTTATDTDGDGDVDEIVVPGEGTWSVDDNGTVTFTPESGFTGDPTPITYTVEDTQGNLSEPATIEADYPQTPTDVEDDSATGKVGTPTTVNILANDTDNEDDTNASSVNLIVPENASADVNATDTDGDGDIDSIVVPGEGTWTVDDNGIVIFTAEDGFTGDPTPITYTVGDNTGETSEPASINIDIKQELRDDNVIGVLHKPRIIHILDNDDAVDPSAVSLSGPEGSTENKDEDGDVVEIIVPGEGIWKVDNKGVLIFTPESYFIESPTPISYIAKDTNGHLSEPARVSIEYSAGSLIKPKAIDDKLIILSQRTYTRDASDNDIFGEGGASKQKYHLLNPKSDKKLIHKKELGVGVSKEGSIGKTVELEYGVISMEENGIYTYTPYFNAVGRDTINYIMEDSIGQTSVANILMQVDCASSQTSDGGDSLETLSMLLMLFIMGMTGIYYIKKEEEVI